MVVEDLQFSAPRTKDYVAFLNAIGAQGKVLLITAETDQFVYRSGRNIPNSTIVSASELNTYDVMKASTVLLSEGAIAKLQEQFA